jgi:hypothetical protein
MEALLEKEGDVENWNDDRLDELSGRVDDGFKEMREGFTRVDREMKAGFARVDEQFARVDKRFEKVTDRLDKLFYIQIVFMGGLAIGLLTDRI